jgi:hypothetical protein
VAPTYINEVTPRHLRGTFGSAFQLGVVLTIFLAQIVSLNPVLGSANRWNYALGIILYTCYFPLDAISIFHFKGLPIVFNVVQVCLLLFVVPESPKYLLINKNDSVGAEKG